ncbi:hypothetical protein B0A48_04826 [Cryoendolithus antarcticus]|uniref:Clr5 domain-containing protein n=1 Tax=Cryoendolithus antarcticus TaxID=1507870 RepID=A0A1V8TDW2_9PEZI|nr:hypothetical protein B0A48_04826 [Cryoendolithus antarcticus]
MPRPKIHLEPYTDEIRAWLEDEKLKQAEVIVRLRELHNVKIELRTLSRFLAEANICVAVHYAKDTELNARITQLHYQVQCSDEETLKLLAQEGFKLDKWRLRRMRWRLGLKQRARALKPCEEGPLQRRRELKEAIRAGEKVEKMEIRLKAASKRIDAVTTELAGSEAANRELAERLSQAEHQIERLRMQGRPYYEPLLP